MAALLSMMMALGTQGARAAEGAAVGSPVAASAPASAVPQAAGQAASEAASQAVAPRLPLEAFASLPRLSGVALSPDGKQLAALLNQGDHTALIRREVSGGKMRVLTSTDNKKFRFQWIRWVGNDQVLASVRFASQRDLVDTSEVRLVSVKVDGSGLFNLTKPDTVSGSMTGATRISQIQDDVIDWMPRDGRHVLLAVPPSDGVWPAVYKVDVVSGERTMVQSPMRDVATWMTDAQHRVRIAVKVVEGRYEVLGRDPAGSEWRSLWRMDADAAKGWPLGFGLDEQELYVLAAHDGRDAVFAVRLDQPGLPRRLLLSNPKYDISGSLLRSPATGEALGLLSAGWDAEGETRAELWSPEWRRTLQAIDKAMPGRNNRLIGLSGDEQHYLLYSSGNGAPGEYYLGTRATGDLTLIGETYPDLSEDQLAGKRGVHIRARDGLSLDAFLTLPTGTTPGQPIPMILLPHGGPNAYDNRDFDYWTEFLANRRYAVLQVNFRGSQGRGNAFASAGLRRWGLEMQDDLTDAVKWAVAEHIADPARICIVGGSYGGYAALMGLVKTPELYRCGVSFAGVSDLQDMIAYQSRYVGGREAVERQIGSFWGDRAQLRATSPALQAERIQAPVLLVHGDEDRVVPVSQSQDMAKALRSAGKPFRYIEQASGDHYLGRNSQRIEFFQALEKFLDEQLAPGRAGAPARQAP